MRTKNHDYDFPAKVQNMNLSTGKHQGNWPIIFTSVKITKVKYKLITALD